MRLERDSRAIGVVGPVRHLEQHYCSYGGVLLLLWDLSNHTFKEDGRSGRGLRCRHLFLSEPSGKGVISGCLRVSQPPCCPFNLLGGASARCCFLGSTSSL